MTREPDPMRGCRPGGSCPDCNPKPLWCQGCLERTVENKDDLCDECAAESEERSCDWCGNPSGDMRWCSAGCRRAAESDYA